METDLQYVDKRLSYHFINRDDLLLQQSILMYTNSCVHMQNTPKQAHTLSESHYERQQGKYQCFKVLPVIFSYFFPPLLYFSPLSNKSKMPKPNRGRGSDFPLSGSQTLCSYNRALCTETGPVCLTVCALTECVCADDLGQYSCQGKQYDSVYFSSPKKKGYVNLIMEMSQCPFSCFTIKSFIKGF